MLPDIIHSTGLINETLQKGPFNALNDEHEWTQNPDTGRAAFFSF